MASKVSGLIEKINSNGISYAIASTAYGYCTTAANESPKTVEMTDFKLYEGVTIHIKFQYANSVANPTLNVQGTGALPIVQYGTTAAGTTAETNGWQAGAVLSLTYDGTSWVRDQGYNTNSWRGIADNLTSSTATTTSLSAKQGYLLANGSARDSTKITKIASSTDNAIVRFDGTEGQVQNSGVTIDDSNNVTIPGTIYFSSNTSTTTGKPLFSYNASYTKFGIWYKEGNPDIMAFSASGNGDSTTSADFAVEGGGKLYNLGKIIPHTGNNTGSVGGVNGPVYIDGGQIKACTTYANATVAAAGKATNDSDGNAINTTYLKLSGGTLTGRISVCNSASPNTSPNNAAVEIREVQRKGTDSNIAHEAVNAPRLGFHWQGRYWAQIALYDNAFRFYNNTLNAYYPVYASTFYGALSGNVTGNADTATRLTAPDTRSIDESPSTLMGWGRGVTSAFKSRSAIGSPNGSGTFGIILNLTPWGDNSGSRPKQLWIDDSSMSIRHSTSDSAWSSWSQFVTNSGTWGISITGSSASCTGNAATATTWQTSRTLTIGNKGQSVNGGSNVSWALQDVLIRAGNEFNYTADGIASLWFNYRTQTGTSATTKITEYNFGNGQGSVTGVILKAAAFSGNAASATKIAAKLAATTKTYLLGTSTTITATAANVDITGDTGVYLTTTAGELSAVRHSYNVSGTEKAYTTYNSTDDSIDFIFL